VSIIRIENLSKRYMISHGRPESGMFRYQSLRDSISGSLKGIVRRISHPLEPSQESATREAFWALKDINLEITEGDRVGIIGNNGAGKTTLLKIISRITEPTTGRIMIYGRVASLLEVGTGFHPELSGRENIFLNGAVLGMTRNEINKKFDEIVDFAGVEKFLDTAVKHYSSGMYVRLAFAVAAHLDPEILLIDEVLAVGDAEFQKKCIGKMEDVSKKGRTILFVSHNMVALRSLCNFSILLKNGHIAATGDTNSVIQQYLAQESNLSGIVNWEKESAPGDDCARIKSIEIISDGENTAHPPVNRDFIIKVTYWNLEKDSRRLVFVHLLNSLGQILITSANSRSASVDYDPWVDRNYPVGLFSTSCTIPANLLNPGKHYVHLFINRTMAVDNFIAVKNALSFEVKETSEWRTDYLGEWIGAVRPRLHWETSQIE
jgi:lipopolysaccharide transport system ATP-binding protein